MKVFIPPQAVIDAYNQLGNLCAGWDRTQSPADQEKPIPPPLKQPYGHVITACEVVEDFPKFTGQLEGFVAFAFIAGMIVGALGALALRSLLAWACRCVGSWFRRRREAGA